MLTKEKIKVNLKNRIKKSKIAVSVSVGVVFGYFLNAAVKQRDEDLDETELVVTKEDVRRMLEEDAIGVYHTEYGPVFTAMSKDTISDES